MNRRKFLNIVGCCGCSYIINSCASVPITDRKQLNLIPEAKLNAQAAQIYEKVKKKEKLITDGRNLKEIKEKLMQIDFEKANEKLEIVGDYMVTNVRKIKGPVF